VATLYKLPVGGKTKLDVGGLRAHCAERVCAGEAASVVEDLLGLVEAMAERMQRMEVRMAHLLKSQYGRRSEQVPSAQLRLALEGIQAHQIPEFAGLGADADAPPASPAEPEKKPRARRKPQPIPESLHRQIVHSDPSPEALICAECAQQKVYIGSERSEILEWVPGSFHVECTERRKYACKPCQSGVVIGPPPQRVLDRGRPGAGLLAEILVRKFKDHTPLERQSRIFTQRYGVPLSPSTLLDWCAGAIDVLEPLCPPLWEQALSSAHLSGDDTVVRVLDKAHEKGVKRGHLWALLGEQEVAVYQYTPSWEGEPIRERLKNYQGTYQGDGYAGLSELFQRDGAPKRAGCLAHARRKFVQALEAGDLRAAGPLALIRKLYEIERLAKESGVDAAERLRRRQAQSAPLMQRLQKGLVALGAQAPPKTPLGQAVGYALRQWPTLQVFLHDGAQPIDNNHTERMLRGISVGRKNWLFAGSDQGARRLAVIYTLVGSCNLAGIADPWAYLRDVLLKLSGNWPQSRITELLPAPWKASRSAP
jgi:transposase